MQIELVKKMWAMRNSIYYDSPSLRLIFTFPDDDRKQEVSLLTCNDKFSPDNIFSFAISFAE